MSYLDKMMGENERPVYSSHQHWIAFMIHSGIALLMLLFAIVVVAAIWIYGDDALAKTVADRNTRLTILAVVSGIILVYPLSHFLLDFFRWRAEIYVITNYRVIQLTGIFDKNVIDSSLEKVNDVVMRQSLLGRWFGYGFIEIVTGSDIGVNKFYRIANPIEFKTAMINAKYLLERGIDTEGMPRPAAANTQAAAPTVADQLAQLANLRDRGVLTPYEFEAQKRKLLGDS